LRSALSGEVLNSIKCLETTANNYEKAWSILSLRYNNTKVLIQSHVKKIFELEAIQSDSAIKLRRFSDALSGHIQALEALGQKPENWGPLLIHLITTKLDKKTLQEWEIGSPKDKISEVPEIIQFLENRFKILEAVESTKNVNTRATTTGHVVTKKYNQSSSLMISAGINYKVLLVSVTTYNL